ncbi:MAG TPA: O-antigen ligase family protein [Natronosporangium sp.]|nr:O-antigen ligase family protein [Natronosporangium sp.]
MGTPHVSNPDVSDPDATGSRGERRDADAPPVAELRHHPPDLDPALVGPRAYASRRRRHLLDAASALGLAAALAVLVPGHLVLPGLGGLGRPVTVFGVALAVCWFATRLHPHLITPGPQPLRWAAAAYLGTILAAYAAGFLRPLTVEEATAADRAVVTYVVYVAVALVCADGIASRARLDDLVRTLVALGVVMALIGHVQVAFGVNLVERIRIPGLVDHREAVEFRARGDGLFQVASTALHYIEFSTVMALLVPFAIHAARHARTGTGRTAAAVGAVLLAAAVPVSLSRTGMVGLAVGLLVLSACWNWRTRYAVGMLGCGLLAVLMVARPGLLGTLRSIFVHAADDPSVQGRTEDYGPAFAYIAERPLLGRGPGTFLPTLYRYIDNDWLVHLITVGVVGTAAYAAWHVTALTLAVIAYRRSEREVDRHLCACLIAAQATAVVVAALFDAMAFTTHTLVLSILTGAAGAMWRFTHPSRRVRTAHPGSGPTAGRVRPRAGRRGRTARPATG